MKQLLLIFLLFFNGIIYAQHTNYPLNRVVNNKIDRTVNQNNIQTHTAFKPFLKSELNSYLDFDSVVYGKNRDSLFLSKRKHTWFWRKLRTEDLGIVETDTFNLRVNILFNFETGKNSITDSTLGVNSRGINVYGDIGNKLSYSSTFYENQAYFIDYIRDANKESRVVPGQGRWRTFKDYGYDYSYAMGYISYSPIKQLNLQLGHDKHFIGEGYRSLLLSDNSYATPFVKFTATFPKIQYTSMYMALQPIETADSRKLVFQREHATVNYLNFLVGKNVQVGLFEGIVWQTSDSTKNNSFNPNFFNPLMMVRPFQFSLDDVNNVLLGANAKIRLSKGIQLYGQFVLDDFSSDAIKSKAGYQAGLKFFDLATIKNLYLQAEYNSVNPYTYAHNESRQAYVNHNEAIAHPLGANFEETVLILNYSVKDFFIELKYNYAYTGVDTLGTNYGSDIFQSDNNYSVANSQDIGRGVSTTITHKAVRVGYVLNPKTNMHLFVGIDNRVYNNSAGSRTSNHIFFGFRTNLSNVYYDF